MGDGNFPKHCRWHEVDWPSTSKCEQGLLVASASGTTDLTPMAGLKAKQILSRKQG